MKILSAPNSYIVKLWDNILKDTHLEWFESALNISMLTYSDWDSDIFNGYAGVFQQGILDTLLAHPDVEYIEEDGMVNASVMVTQNDAPWGLCRINQKAKLKNQHVNALNFTYRYESSAGAGVDIYIIDSGIYLNHSDFGGRAKWGATFGGYKKGDQNGHGTHVAATAAGTRFGVAKKANLIAVKVLGADNKGWASDRIAGVNWVSKRVSSTHRPSVINMSLHAGASVTFDKAVTSITTKGVHVIVAAGNKNADASKWSPARAAAAITVGSTTIQDARSSFSNYGPVVDVFAPGTRITSAAISSRNSTAVKSGTSMAAPHVAGIIATLISRDGNLAPAAMSAKLVALAIKDAITGLPIGTLNLLARNKF
ncbi:serine protease [Lentinus tigrinus ALCF2SS1-7]|uniref:Serine protease n=1 Tax=Lentinus tigrinus ALCF2SS1-6 TaxID=1328759 RepID=A0A5C2S0C5_9APHY|nr:serine protease [Lentinus tigrinus ALCF2SS1-6]RPD71126.1 serine protease [Lentinus tigrinus ALCF2SS1-7]